MRISYDHFVLLQALYYEKEYIGIPVAAFEDASRQGHITQEIRHSWVNVAITPLGRAVMHMHGRSYEENGQTWFDLEPQPLSCDTVISVKANTLEQFIQQSFNRSFDIDSDPLIEKLDNGGVVILATWTAFPAQDKAFQAWLAGKTHKGTIIHSILASLAMAGTISYGTYHITRSW